MATFTTTLHDMPLVELLDRATAVRAMTDTPGWHVIRAMVDERQASLRKQIESPSLPSYEKLAALTGEVRGLAAMVEAAEQVLTVAEERERETQDRVEG